ncbi:MAG: trimethylamine methyltransferase family protein [Myxococcales bacterium]|nr:trimethylamine methyltransferase family protein [Myxococcales bacterium]MDH5566879.1 trimethylamine methyltransferase family protein [Myxococcales bacterium]
MVQIERERPARRRGEGSARDRRRAQRAAASAASAVGPGLKGGSFRPLSERDMQRIHATALDVLEQIGMGSPTQSILDACLPKGAVLSESGRLCFPRGLMEDVIDGACKEFTFHGTNPARDVQVGGDRVYFRTAGEAVNIFDYATRDTRPSTLVDLYDTARLADRLDNLHCFCQTVVATEHSGDAFVHDINALYAQLAGTQKPCAVSTATADHIDHFIALLDIFLGGEGEFLKRPCFNFGGCPVVSPLRFGSENAEVLVKCARLGISYDIAVASQAGATAPAALAGALVQTFAETLATLAVMNLIRPGIPFLMGAWPFISDLRTGSFTGGSGEQALVASAMGQLCNFYGLPSSVSASMTDSKLPDAQAGYEKGLTAGLAALAGCNYIGESAGMLGSLMACSFEAMVIDNDMLGNILRAVRGIEVTDETLSFQSIKDSVEGVGHFLDHPQTLALMESEYQYPQVADRSTYADWRDRGKLDAYALAHERAALILADHYPVYIDPAVDAAIRERFPIVLKPEDMRPGNGRW